MTYSNKDLQETLDNVATMNSIDYNSNKEKAIEYAASYFPKAIASILSQKHFKEDSVGLIEYDKNGYIIPPSPEVIEKITDHFKFTKLSDYVAMYRTLLNDFYNAGYSYADDIVMFNVIQSYILKLQNTGLQSGDDNVFKGYFSDFVKTVPEEISKKSYDLTQQVVAIFSPGDKTISQEQADARDAARKQLQDDIKKKHDQELEEWRKNHPDNNDDGDGDGDFMGGLALGFTHAFGIVTHLLEGDLSDYVSDISNPKNPKSKDLFGLDEFWDLLRKSGAGIIGFDPTYILYAAMALGGLILYNQIRPLIKDVTSY